MGLGLLLPLDLLGGLPGLDLLDVGLKHVPHPHPDELRDFVLDFSDDGDDRPRFPRFRCRLLLLLLHRFWRWLGRLALDIGVSTILALFRCGRAATPRRLCAAGCGLLASGCQRRTRTLAPSG